MIYGIFLCITIVFLNHKLNSTAVLDKMFKKSNKIKKKKKKKKKKQKIDRSRKIFKLSLCNF